MERLNGTRPLDYYAIAPDSVINCGDLVALNSSGQAVAASDTASIRVVGIAEQICDNGVEVADGVFALANDQSDPVTRQQRGDVCFVKDGQTVNVQGGTNHIVAGIVVDVYENQVYVEITPTALKAAAGTAQA